MTQTPPFPFAVVLAVAVVTFLMPLDVTALAMALQDIQADIGATFAELTWIVNCYNVVYTAFLPIAGLAIARFGIKACFIAACGLFAAASLLCGLSQNTPVLVVGRLLQGSSGAIVLISGIAALRTYLPEERFGKAFSIWGTALGLGTALGPVLGELIVSTLGWRFIFFINVPLAGLAVLPFLSRAGGAANARISAADLALPLVCGLALAVLSVTVEKILIDPLSVMSLGIALAFAAAILMAARGLRTGRVNDTLGLYLLQSPTFSVGTLLGVLLGFSFWALVLYWPGFLMAVHGFSAITVAALMLVMTAPLFVMPAYGAQLAQRLPAGQLHGAVALAQIVGLTIIACATGGIAVGIGFAVLGTATALINAEVSNLAIGSASQEEAGLASSLNMTARHAALTIGIAVYGSMIGAVALTQMELAASTSAAIDIVTKMAVGDLAAANHAAVEAGVMIDTAELQSAIALGFRAVCAVAILAAVLAVCLSLIALPVRRRALAADRPT